MKKKTYTVTHDRYSNEPVQGTKGELQQQFDDLGWNVSLQEDVDGDLYDENSGHFQTVAELNS